MTMAKAKTTPANDADTGRGHGAGWWATARRLAAITLMAIGGLWFIGREMLVAVATAIGTALVAVAIWRAVVARRRGEVLDILCDYLTAQGRSDFTVRKARWRSGTVDRITLCYTAKLDDRSLEVRQTIESLVGHKLDGRFGARWRTERNEVEFTRRHDSFTEVPLSDPVIDRTNQVIKTQFPADTKITGPQHDERGEVVGYTIRYPTMSRDINAAFRHRVLVELNEKTPGGPWKLRWDLERDLVMVERAAQLPNFVPFPLEVGQTCARRGRLISGTGEAGVHAWNTDPNTGVPHALVNGPTGSGKTVKIRAFVVAAVIAGWRVLICDPKEYEFVGFEKVPGVEAVATALNQQIAVIDTVHREMNRRTRLLKAAKRTGQPLPRFESLLVIIDEFIDFKEAVDRLWAQMKAENSRLKGKEHPVIGKIRSIAVKIRSVDGHLIIGTQRPDVDFMTGAIRAQIRYRASLMSLDPQGAKMMWEHHSRQAIDLPNIKGRALETDDLGRPTETQGFWVPDPGDYPRLNETDRQFVDDLTRMAADAVGDREPLLTLPAPIEAEDDDEDLDGLGSWVYTADAGPDAVDGQGTQQVAAGVEPDIDLPTEPVDVADLEEGTRIVIDGPDGQVVVDVIDRSPDPEDGDRVDVEYVDADGTVGTLNLSRFESVESVME